MPDQLHSVSELNFQPVTTLHPSPTDWSDQFIYFLLVDRFDNNSPNLQAYTEGRSTGRNAEQGKRFQNGNLKGITRRLDYIKKLG